MSMKKPALARENLTGKQPCKRKYQPRDALPRSVRRVAGRAAAALAAEAKARQAQQLAGELVGGDVGDTDAERQAKLAEALERIKAQQNRPKLQKQKSLSAQAVQPDPHTFILDKALRKWQNVTKDKSISSKQWH